MHDNSAGDFHDQILLEAQRRDCNPALVYMERGLDPLAKSMWYEPKSSDDCGDVYVKNINLIAQVDQDNVLAKFVTSLADSVQFPRSTAFLHGLGIVAAAMTENFFYNLYGRENTVGIYAVSAQPPSTGKSAINSGLYGPADEAYMEKSKFNKIERAKIELKIAEIKSKLKKTKGLEADSIAEELIEEEERLEEYPLYSFFLNDPTAEGCEVCASKQAGFYNIVSDESSSVSVILGKVYGSDKGGSKSNHGIFLNGWDNGMHKVARAGRKGFEGRVRSSIVVLGQDPAIETILSVGQDSGEGISERFLMLREPNLLGRRDHMNRKGVCEESQEQYAKLMKNIVGMRLKTVLTFSQNSKDLMSGIQDDLEPLMADGEKYSTPLLRGVAGKAANQISKIASVLHVIKEWSSGGGRKKEIQSNTVLSAHMIFKQLMSTYVAAADSKGFVGKKTELEYIIKSLTTTKAKKKKNVIKINDLRGNIRKASPFKGVEKLTEKLKQEYLPELEKSAHVVFKESTGEIFINPHLEG